MVIVAIILFVLAAFLVAILAILYDNLGTRETHRRITRLPGATIKGVGGFSRGLGQRPVVGASRPPLAGAVGALPVAAPVGPPAAVAYGSMAGTEAVRPFRTLSVDPPADVPWDRLVEFAADRLPRGNPLDAPDVVAKFDVDGDGIAERVFVDADHDGLADAVLDGDAATQAMAADESTIDSVGEFLGNLFGE